MPSEWDGFLEGKINKNGPLPKTRPDLGPCWIWKGVLTPRGYGLLWANGRLNRAHRFIYELLHGPIGKGLQPDHLCRTPSCVNPSHLEPVTAQVNTLRGNGPTAKNAQKTHCWRGHPFDKANTRTDLLKSGGTGRACRACARLRWNRIKDEINRKRREAALKK